MIEKQILLKLQMENNKQSYVIIPLDEYNNG